MIELQLIKQLQGASGGMEIDVDLQIPSGSITGIIGPSGAGKTSLLKMIAGIQSPDRGRISVGDKVYYDSATGLDTSPQKRDVGLVFQDLALFPHMDLEAQLRYALPDALAERSPNGQGESIIDEAIKMMGLEELRGQRPQRLSGGQQQRVALARSVVQRPSLLLLDEPFSALDDDMKQEIRSYVRSIHERYKMTILLVSHDHGDISELCDHVIHLDHGKVMSHGPVSSAAIKSYRHILELSGRVIGLQKKDEDSYVLSLDIQGDVREVIITKQQAEDISIDTQEGSTIDLKIDLQ